MARTTVDASGYSPGVRQIHDGLTSRVIGQDLAAELICRQLEIEEAGLNEPGRPAVILFAAGPPGVGKTETAFALAETWIGKLVRGHDGSPLVPATVIDCTQYANQHDVANLVGSTKGFVGYGDETPLSQMRLDRYDFEVRFDRAKRELGPEMADADPFGKEMLVLAQKVGEEGAPFRKVIVFDEVGRSHSNLWNVLITLMNGKPITMSDGSFTEFTRACLIMTDNIGERAIQEIMKGEGIGFRQDLTEINAEKLNDMIFKRVLREMEVKFPPPFVSRVRKHIVVYRPLTKEVFRKILALRLDEAVDAFNALRPEGAPPCKFTFSKKVVEFLLEKGVDPRFGARPMKDTVRKHVVYQLAFALNSGLVPWGSSIGFLHKKGSDGGSISMVIEKK
jgi:ATP-dependent Clp protease ATP-binding subunit ClpC